MVRWIMGANEPTVLEQGGFERIADIAGRVFVDPEGQSRPYLSPEEATALQVMRGSLTREERFEIESHVVHTYNFLRQIPWGRQFRQVPDIAGAHHEKLDGTGYPNQLRGDEIPVPARMMTIADIFDALTAKDRPYKRAMPVERALDILGYEPGRIDGIAGPKTDFAMLCFEANNPPLDTQGLPTAGGLPGAADQAQLTAQAGV